MLFNSQADPLRQLGPLRRICIPPSTNLAAPRSPLSALAAVRQRSALGLMKSCRFVTGLAGPSQLTHGNGLKSERGWRCLRTVAGRRGNFCALDGRDGTYGTHGTYLGLMDCLQIWGF